MWLSLRVSAFGLLICFKMSIVDQINPNILMTHSSSSCAPSARRCSLPHKFPNNLMSFPRRTQCARRRATRTGGFNRRPCQNAEKPPQCAHTTSSFLLVSFTDPLSNPQLPDRSFRAREFSKIKVCFNCRNGKCIKEWPLNPNLNERYIQEVTNI